VEIKEDEIKEVKKLGTLNGSEVKLITLKGGFHIGMGKKESSAKKSDILAVGSHPALISHQISQKFKSKFEQSMAKNEKDQMPSLKDYSHNLTSTQKNVLGLDIYAMKKNENVEFTVTKHNFEIFSISANESGGEIVLEKTEKNKERLKNIDKKGLSQKLEKSIKEYAKEHNLTIKKNF
jgi:hypothetical protein